MQRSSSLRPPLAVLIDAMGTLVSLQPPAPLLVAELRRRHGIVVTLEQADRALGVEIVHYLAHMDEGRDAGAVDALHRRCAAVLRDALDVGLGDRDLTDALLGSLRFAAYDDAREALLALRHAGLRVVVASNWDVSLNDVLERVGLAPLLDGVVTSAAVGAAKPRPAIFHHALAVAGVDAAHAWHVGDQFDEDVAGARASGVEPILLRRDGHDAGEPPGGVTTIATLRELAPAVLAGSLS